MLGPIQVPPLPSPLPSPAPLRTASPASASSSSRSSPPPSSPGRVRGVRYSQGLHLPASSPQYEVRPPGLYHIAIYGDTTDYIAICGNIMSPSCIPQQLTACLPPAAHPRDTNGHRRLGEFLYIATPGDGTIAPLTTTALPVTTTVTIVTISRYYSSY